MNGEWKGESKALPIRLLNFNVASPHASPFLSFVRFACFFVAQVIRSSAHNHDQSGDVCIGFASFLPVWSPRIRANKVSDWLRKPIRKSLLIWAFLRVCNWLPNLSIQPAVKDCIERTLNPSTHSRRNPDHFGVIQGQNWGRAAAVVPDRTVGVLRGFQARARVMNGY